MNSIDYEEPILEGGQFGPIPMGNMSLVGQRKRPGTLMGPMTSHIGSKFASQAKQDLRGKMPVVPKIPAAKMGRPGAKPSSPMAKRPSPMAKRPSPMAKRPSPMAKRPSPMAKRPSPMAKRPSPMAKRPSPVAKRASPVAQRSMPFYMKGRTGAKSASSSKVVASSAAAAKKAKNAKIAKLKLAATRAATQKKKKIANARLVATAAASAKKAKAAQIARRKLLATRAATQKAKKIANARLVATSAAAAKKAKSAKVAKSKKNATRASESRKASNPAPQQDLYEDVNSLYSGGSNQDGGGYQFGPAITHGLINNYGQEVIAGKPLIPDCVAAVKPDTMGFTGPKGLPGLSGGRRQSGGRYGFVSAEGAAISGPPSMGGLAPMSKIPCEASTPNPMNPVKIGGGAPPLTGASLGGDNQAYYAPTAGYSNGASTWVGSTGSPSLIQTPYEAKSMNPACLKTGGGKRTRKNRKSRKNRTVNRR